MPPSVNLTNAARRTEEFLFRYGAWLVALVAVLYYAQYYRSGLNVGGEGGTIAVVAMRLMEGQRPIVDTTLDYNVMWFYPVVWLFQLTGPNYLALRIYFFALCTLTGLMAFFVGRKVSGRGWFGVLAALGPVLIPGMIFRNYMGFLTVLNMLCLLQAYVFEQRTRIGQLAWMVAAGLALGLTYLIRIEIGIFFSVMAAGLLVLYPFGKPREGWKRFFLALAGLGLTLLLLLGTQAPFYFDAVQRKYDKAFLGQYGGLVGTIRYQASQQAEKKMPQEKSQAATPTPAPKPSDKDINVDDYMPRTSLDDLLRNGSFYERAFVVITYLPILLIALIVLFGGGYLLAGLGKGNFSRRTDALVLLVTCGSALTLFPQFFFFRPDTPHLSEFMVPFMVAMACAGWIVVTRTRGHRLLQTAAAGFVALCLLDAGLYLDHAFRKESSGSIFARHQRKYRLVAENGVDVLLKRPEYEGLSELCRVIKTYTRPGDYLISYPYSPTVNFMTDRPSYLHRLYMDNAHRTADFHDYAVREIGKYRPAAIVIDNRDINHTEESRFKNWAAETYAWIRENYSYAGTFRRQEVYLRPDLYPKEEALPAQ